eukprot:scaffold124794_cov63-Phaeocystis_antarctica.AAC.1
MAVLLLVPDSSPSRRCMIACRGTCMVHGVTMSPCVSACRVLCVSACRARCLQLEVADLVEAEVERGEGEVSAQRLVRARVRVRVRVRARVGARARARARVRVQVRVRARVRG